jgi:hypothetical protein
MFAEMDIAARNSWFRSDAYIDDRIPLQARSTFRESEWAFCHTFSVLKSDTPQSHGYR